MEHEDQRAKQIREILEANSFSAESEISQVISTVKKSTDELAVPIARNIIQNYSAQMDSLVLECFFEYNNQETVAFESSCLARLENITQCVYESLRGYEDKDAVVRILTDDYARKLISDNLSCKEESGSRHNDHDGLTLLFRHASFDIGHKKRENTEEAIKKQESLERKMSGDQKSLRKAMVECFDDLFGKEISSLFETSLKFGKKNISSGLYEYGLSLFYFNNYAPVFKLLEELLQDSISSRKFPESFISFIIDTGSFMDESTLEKDGFKAIQGEHVVGAYKNLAEKKYFKTVLYAIYHSEDPDLFIKKINHPQVQKLIKLVAKKISPVESSGEVIAQAFKTAIISGVNSESFDKYLAQLNMLFSKEGIESKEDAFASIKGVYFLGGFNTRLSKYATAFFESKDSVLKYDDFFEKVEYLAKHIQSDHALDTSSEIVSKIKAPEEEAARAVISIAYTLCRSSDKLGKENFDKLLRLYSENCENFRWQDFDHALGTAVSNISELENKDLVISRICQTYERLK